MALKSCAFCNNLHSCEEVTTPKILDNYCCNNYAQASDPDVLARQQIIKDFGLWALKYGVTRLQPKSVKTRSRRRKKNG